MGRRARCTPSSPPAATTAGVLVRRKAKVGKGQTGHKDQGPKPQEGDKDKDLWGKASKWVDYWGKVGEKEVGVAIFDHPKNPRYPTTWHARDYGLVAANPFGYSYFFKGEGKKGTLTIKAGESVTFRYGFLFHPGGHDADKLKAVYDLFSQTEAE